MAARAHIIQEHDSLAVRDPKAGHFYFHTADPEVPSSADKGPAFGGGRPADEQAIVPASTAASATLGRVQVNERRRVLPFAIPGAGEAVGPAISDDKPAPAPALPAAPAPGHEIQPAADPVRDWRYRVPEEEGDSRRAEAANRFSAEVVVNKQQNVKVKVDLSSRKITNILKGVQDPNARNSLTHARQAMMEDELRQKEMNEAKAREEAKLCRPRPVHGSNGDSPQ